MSDDLDPGELADGKLAVDVRRVGFATGDEIEALCMSGATSAEEGMARFTYQTPFNECAVNSGFPTGYG
jgi:hypothetical protein